MSVRCERTENEIDEVLNKADEQLDSGTKWPGMSYEEGVAAALRWVLGDSDDDPMSED